MNIIYSLAETLLLRNLEPPLTVGILGGRNSGKSSVLHFLLRRMMEIRSHKVSQGWNTDESKEPYVGHIFPIKFDAWMHTKSDIGVDLIQTIFMELNKLISFEQLFSKQQLLDGRGNWLELSQLGDKEQLALLETSIGVEALATWQRDEELDGLWNLHDKINSASIRRIPTKGKIFSEWGGEFAEFRKDLQDLTDMMTIDDYQDLFEEEKKSFFPRGPARVALFIDGLDRCPPTKVVEIIETVQRFLSTKLFIVIMALDTHYVSRVLEKEYTYLDDYTDGPSGLDYIEEIIHIPYHVPPVEPDSRRAFIMAKMNITTDITAKNELLEEEVTVAPPVEQTESFNDTLIEIEQPIIKFEEEDFVYLAQISEVLELSTRRINRLIEILKLIKIFWFRQNQNKTSEELHTVIHLLALTAGFPEIMTQVFYSLEFAYRENNIQDKLSDYLKPDLGIDKLLIKNAEFKTAVAKLNLEDITLAELGLETFHLVRSFSFVGDPTYAK